MSIPADSQAPRSPDHKLAILFFILSFLFSLWAATVGWKNGNLRGVEFRQAQTALSTYFIQQDNDFSLAYPTPVLGKPWSIPMEFPLYQWSVAGLSNVSGLELVSSARLIGLACFYLTLPAIFLLLGQWNLARGQRWLVLGLIVSSPLYIFYARAFLIETMALTLSVWFLLAYWRSVNTAHWGWLLAANVLGAGAGLVKVTTFILYLVPAALGTLMLLWQRRSSPSGPDWAGIRRILWCGMIATAVPFALTFWWMHFADVVKALNPSSRFLLSSNLNGYHFGTTATRFAADIWAGHWRIFSETVIWLPLVGASGIALLCWGRRWWSKVFFCFGCFVGVQLLFPELYAWHDYYYVANTLFLLVGMGVSIAAIFESNLPRWVGAMVMAGMLSGQIHFYWRNFYPMQSVLSPEGSDLTRVLQKVTHPGDVLLIQGEDWNSMIPYYTRRRALMLRGAMDHDAMEMREAFTRLKGESVGALVTTGTLDKDAPLLKLAVEFFGFNPEPVLKWHDKSVYFPQRRWDEVFDKSESTTFYDVSFLPGGRLAQDNLAGRWYEVDKLRRYHLGSLKYIEPRPVRFFVRFGLSLTGNDDAPQFGMHPDSRLRFKLPVGPHRLRTSAGLSPGAYENLPADQASDGIDVSLTVFQSGAPDRLIYTRNLNPHDKPEDRGAVPIDVAFEMPPDAEIELSVTSGPAGSDRRDWAFLGRLVIE